MPTIMHLVKLRQPMPMYKQPAGVDAAMWHSVEGQAALRPRKFSFREKNARYANERLLKHCHPFRKLVTTHFHCCGPLVLSRASTPLLKHPRPAQLCIYLKEHVAAVDAMLCVGAGGGYQLFLNDVERRGIFALDLVN